MSNLTELLPLVAIIIAFKIDELVGEKREKQFYWTSHKLCSIQSDVLVQVNIFFNDKLL